MRLIKLSEGKIKKIFFANVCCILKGSGSQLIKYIVNICKLPLNIIKPFLIEFDKKLKKGHRKSVDDINFQSAILPQLIDVNILYYKTLSTTNSYATKYDLGKYN